MPKSDPTNKTRSTLLVRLKDLDDQKAWQDFFDTYWMLLYNFSRRTGLNEHESEEIVMATVELVARKIDDFEYNRKRGRFKSWLLAIVRNKIGDLFRKRKRLAQRGEMVSIDNEAAEYVVDPKVTELEKLWETEWQKRLIDMALERVKKLVGHRQYQIFYCYVIQEQKADEVADFFDVSKNQVYVAKNRVSKIFEGELEILKGDKA